ncbi:MAG: hypothetical protein H7061_00465 [Bdellovibrionaceae bacterium]|nr:hypothetical protein [Bdellovibrio sp.]
MTSMVPGENSDLYINGSQVHVQTEDWGLEQKVLMSRVFKNGSVFKTFKLGYEKIAMVESEKIRRDALVRFHQTIIDWSYQQI